MAWLAVCGVPAVTASGSAPPGRPAAFVTWATFTKLVSGCATSGTNVYTVGGHVIIRNASNSVEACAQLRVNAAADAGHQHAQCTPHLPVEAPLPSAIRLALTPCLLASLFDRDDVTRALTSEVPLPPLLLRPAPLLGSPWSLQPARSVRVAMRPLPSSHTDCVYGTAGACLPVSIPASSSLVASAPTLDLLMHTPASLPSLPDLRYLGLSPSRPALPLGGEACSSTAGTPAPATIGSCLVSTLLHGVVMCPGQCALLPLFGQNPATTSTSTSTSTNTTSSASEHTWVPDGYTMLQLWPEGTATDLSGAAVESGAGVPHMFRVDATDSHLWLHHNANASEVDAEHTQLRLPSDPSVPPLHEMLAAASALAPGCSDVLRSLIPLIHTHSGSNRSISATAAARTGLRSLGVLLTGPPGCGKSHLVRAVAASTRRPVFLLSPPTVYSGVAGQSEAQLYSLLATAQEVAPCTLVIEEADIIMPAEAADDDAGEEESDDNADRGGSRRAGGGGGGGGVSPLSRRISNILQSALTANALKQLGVCVLAVSSRPQAIDPAAFAAWTTVTGSSSGGWAGPGGGLGAAHAPLSHVIQLGMPSPLSRYEILRHITASWPVTADVGALDAALVDTAARCHGYSPADLQHVCTEAALAAANTSQSSRDGSAERSSGWASAFAAAVARVPPSLLSLAVGHLPPSVPISTIIGNADNVQRALDAVLMPLEHASAFHAHGASPPTGLLLHGPSGCGKTLLAHALATEVKRRGLAHALTVNATELIGAVVGSSEAAVAALFARARELAPCVLVLDRFELLAPARYYGTSRGSDLHSSDDDASDEEGDSAPASLGSGGTSAATKLARLRKAKQRKAARQGAGGGGGGHSDRLLSVFLTELDGVLAGSGQLMSASPAAVTVAAASTTASSAASAVTALSSHPAMTGILQHTPTSHVTQQVPLVTLPPLSYANALVAIGATKLAVAEAAAPAASAATSTASSGEVSHALSKHATSLLTRGQPGLVYVIAVTEDRRMLDPAVLRPGRLDTHVHLLPPSPADRAALLRACFAKSPLGASLHAGASEPHALSDAAVTWLVGVSDGWPHARLVALWESAALQAIRRTITTAGSEAASTSALIEKQDVEWSLAHSAARQLAAASR